MMNDLELTIIKNLWCECDEDITIIDFIIKNKLGDKMTVGDVAKIIKNMSLQTTNKCHWPLASTLHHILHTILDLGSSSVVNKYIKRHPKIIHMTVNQVKRLNIK